MNFNQIKRAIIAKTKDKSNMPDWYYKRLEKCIECEFNSGNSEKLSLKDRLRISHNFGKDSCLKCTCGVEDKSSDPQEKCPENFWGKEKKDILNKLNIVVKTKKVIFNFNDKLNKYTVEYGTIPYQFDSKIKLIILDKNIKNLKTSTSCGCTTAEPKQTEEGLELEIKYDTLRIGSFEKAIKLSYMHNDIAQQTIINIRGEVTKQNK